MNSILNPQDSYDLEEVMAILVKLEFEMMGIYVQLNLF